MRETMKRSSSSDYAPHTLFFPKCACTLRSVHAHRVIHFYFLKIKQEPPAILPRCTQKKCAAHFLKNKSVRPETITCIMFHGFTHTCTLYLYILFFLHKQVSGDTEAKKAP